jgi:hypothetical protein
MAIRKVTEGIGSWNSKTPFPKDRYAICCIEESFAPSKGSGNPMITRVWEIVSPEVVTNGDRQMNVAGLKMTQYCITKVKDPETKEWDSEKSDKAFGRFATELQLLGYPPEQDVDDENPPLFAKGKTVDAIVSAKKDVARKNPTPEQLRKGQRFGDPIKDANGKDVETYQLQIESILGLSDIKVDAAY